jgi:hypothetical protein
MTLYWLSFASETTGFLGACVVEADDTEEAIKAAWRQGINPGGWVCVNAAPESWRQYAGRLIGREEATRICATKH